MSHPPLISVPVLRPLVIRAALMAVAGALYGLAAGIVVGSGPAMSLIGLWWAFMVFPLGVVEVWGERRQGGWRTKATMGLMIVGVAALMLGLGGLQYQYGLGVVRGGEIGAGYRRVVWVLGFVQPQDALVFIALLTPFVADSLSRDRRLLVELGIVLLAVSLTSLPNLWFSDHMGARDQRVAVAMVLGVGVFLPLAAAASDRFCARTWPAEEPPVDVPAPC